MRILQHLHGAAPSMLADGVILRLLHDDQDLAPDLPTLLRDLIWLEDRGLCRTEVGETEDGQRVLARLLMAGACVITGEAPTRAGIYQPWELADLEAA
jgi:hypothetical protein